LKQNFKTKTICLN